MKGKNIFLIIIAIIVSLAMVIYQGQSKKNNEPIIAYRVYLEGKDIGLIKSKDELDEYINKKQESLKNKYNVDKIHIPNNINIVKDVTYDDNIVSVDNIYNKINNISPFTIEGYQITIDKTNSSSYVNDDNVEDENEEKIIKLNVLDKDIFVKAVEKVITSFVSSDDYEAFINDNQLQIETTGELIEDIYIDDEITIKEAYITVSEDIYMDVDELAKYLIFGNHETDEKYTVKTGDTIDEIASQNEMSVNELLIANNNISSETSLLYVGQELSIGTLDPIFTTIVEKHVVTDQIVKYTTKYKYDKTQYTGYTKKTQEGSNGVTRVTQKVKLINGEISNAYIASSEEIVPMIEEVVIKGGKQPPRGDGRWFWPTKIPYIISSPYGWRWGKLHEGLDICGTGSGSPIYAARDGIVTRLGWMKSGGYYVELKHDNGYYTHYLHMLSSTGSNKYGGESSAAKYVSVGDYVAGGT
ncbi:MAG: G5 domain-containing protein, partial [Bacilli bacterium]|nr:G5 domain-containing protein [Bacilli bacterium]